jgi:hypothetical protein
MHATSPAFPVHLTACCMINLLPCFYCPSVSLLHDLLPALPGIETNAQMFRYRSLGSKRNQNVLVCSKIFFFKKGTFQFIPKTFERHQNVLLCSRIFYRNVTIYSKNLKTKQKRFGVFQKTFWAKQNFSNVLKNLKTKQTIYL